MRFIEPKRAVKVHYTVSGQTAAILENYAKYTGYSEEEIVDRFLKNILSDPKFAKYIRGQRRSKRIVNRIFLGDIEMSLLDEYAKDAPLFNYDAEADEENASDKGDKPEDSSETDEPIQPKS